MFNKSLFLLNLVSNLKILSMFEQLTQLAQQFGVESVVKNQAIPNIPIHQERGIQARFSVDLLNATNHTNFSGPNTNPSDGNFGRVTSQRGLPRVLQFNLRVEF